MNRVLTSQLVDALSFRSLTICAATRHSPRTQLHRNMSSNTSALSVDELKQKSAQADELIKKLKSQIEQIKTQTTEAYKADKVKKLQKENEDLKKRVEELKKELDDAEAKRGPTTAAVAAPTSAPAAAKEQKSKQEAAKDQAQAKPKNDQPKPAKQQQQQPAKKQEEVIDPKNVNVSMVDIRIGKILEVAKHPEADALYVEQIDLGEAKPRNVCSGLVKHIPLDGMQDKMVVVVCNLKPTKLRGVLSEAMVLCASTPEKVELMVPPPGAAVGDRVTCVGFEGVPVAEINQKNNIFGLVQPDLLTNDALLGCYKGVPLEIKGKGPIKSSTLKNVPVK